MNTAVEYLYRDAGSYRRLDRQVVTGEISINRKIDILNACDDGDYFIPMQVGLPETRIPSESAEVDNHPWFELMEVYPTDDEATVPLTADELYHNFIISAGNWNDTIWQSQIG